LAALEKNGIKAAFVPQFNSLTHLTEFSSISYGMANWGPRTPGHFDWVSRVKGLTTKCIFPIVEQDIRTRGPMYFESEGSALLRGLWENAIADGADWAYINTWSDYTEQAMAPSRAIGFAPFDMDAYYTQWFKTGSKPEIKRDVLYYFYRIHHSSAPAARGAVWTMPPWVQNRDPYNWIEVVGFLKKPGTLRIDVDGKTYEKEAPAGITSFKAPVPPGRTFVPVFSLERGGKTVVSRPGQYAVLDKVEFRNLLCHSGVISPDAAR